MKFKLYGMEFEVRPQMFGWECVVLSKYDPAFPRWCRFVGMRTKIEAIHPGIDGLVLQTEAANNIPETGAVTLFSGLIEMAVNPK
jgi:hypothetical protein